MFFLRYKSDSSFNIINVAIISYSSEIRRVSKLLFFSYAYLLPNFFILIGLVANFLLCTPSARVLKLNCLVVKVVLPVQTKHFLILL